MNNAIIGDPTELVVLPHGNQRGPGSRLQAFHIEPISLVVKTHAGIQENSTLEQRVKGVRFYSMNMLYQNLSVSARLYFASSAADLRIHVQPTSWESGFTNIISKSTTRILDEEDDGFIVDDHTLDGDHNEPVRGEPVSAYVQRRKGHADSRSEDNWTVNYELTVQRLNEVDVSEITDINEVLEEAQGVPKTTNSDNIVPLRTLRELAEGEVSVLDVEEASVSLEELKLGEPGTPRHVKIEDAEDQPEPSMQLALRSVALLPVVLNYPTSQVPGSDTLSHFHNNIVNHWISPMSDHMSDMVRLSKEQLARRMAAEVALASQVLRVQEPPIKQPTQSQSQSQDQMWDLPVRPPPTPSTSRATPSVYFDASSQPQSPSKSRRSPSVTPSVATGSSFPSTFTAPPISRLSHYTNFSGNLALPPLPRRLNRVLAHWVPGADPASYEWLTASRHFSQRDEEEAEGEGMTEKERSRMERRTQRYVRRQRREAEASQRQQMLSSQAPEIVTASQPAPVSRANSQPAALGGDSQSQEVSQPMASQVLPGRHGGRPARKKRKSGF